jgi:hypothetical protein
MKKLILITVFFFSLLSGKIFAQQSIDLQWAKQIGGINAETCTSIAVDASGNTYSIGYFSGTADFDPGPGTFNMTATGTYDAFVLKLDTSGNLMWAKRFGGNSGTIGNSIEVDMVGNVYITGSWVGTTDFNPGTGTYNLTETGGQNDVFICKLNAAGNFVWAKQVGGTGDDMGHALCLDASANVYVTGYFYGTVDFNPGAGTYNLTASNYDIFVLKLDSSGSFIWARKMGGPNWDQAYSITVDNSGNVYTTGSFQGTADFDPGAGTANLVGGTSFDAFVSKLNSSGNYVWAKQFSGPDTESGKSIITDASGNVYTAGIFQGTVDFDPGPSTYNLTVAGGSLSNDIFISKLDVSGNFVWAKQMGGTASDNVQSIALDASGNIYTTGSFQGTADFDPGIGTYNITSAGSSDGFISKLDNSGNFVWAKQYGDTLYDGGVSIKVNASGSLFTMGNFQATIDLDPSVNTFNLTSFGNTDVFVAKYNPCFAIGTPVISGTNNVCIGQVYTFSILPITNATDYNWTVPPGATINSGQNTTSINVTFGASSGSVCVTASNACYSSPTVCMTVSIHQPFNNEQICVVTVDTSINKNKIVWEKTPNVGTDHYKILKESTYAGVYNLLGLVPYDSMSVFTDTSSHPEMMLARYRILVVDTCGNESDTSIMHQTLHLQVSAGVPTGHQLLWNAYQGSFSFGTYYIYAGSTPTNLVKIDSLANTIFNVTYTNPPVGQKYYQVIVKKSDSCIATSSAKDQSQTYNTAVSNMEEYAILGVDENQNNLFSLNAYPNPFNNSINISYKLQERTQVKIEIYNVLQEKVADVVNAEQLSGNYNIDFGDDHKQLSNGVYYIRAMFNDNTVIKKVIKL